MPFDPDTFLNQDTSGPLATTIRPAPEGEYQAVVSADGEQKDWFREAEWEDKKTGEHRSAPVAEIPMEITDPRIKAALPERDRVIVPFKFFLDMKDGRLDTGPDKNIRLGQLRAALGQNGPGPWNWSMLRGAGPVLVKVTQRSDPKDPERKFAEVTKVTRIV